MNVSGKLEDAGVRRFLFVLDFDNTLVSHKGDRLVTVQSLFPDSVIPDHLEQIRNQHGWDEFLQVLVKLPITPVFLCMADRQSRNYFTEFSNSSIL